MAVLLFVHGVATRSGPEYDTAVEARGRRFRETVFAGVPLRIHDAYWGAFGADPRWKLACIPDIRAQHVHLGILGEETGASDHLLSAARVDLAPVVAALSVENLRALEGTGDEEALKRAERFWRAAAAYIRRSPQPDWLSEVDDDDECRLVRATEPRAG